MQPQVRNAGKQPVGTATIADAAITLIIVLALYGAFVYGIEANCLEKDVECQRERAVARRCLFTHV